MSVEQNARLSVAPMMDWTDRHCRLFHRQLSTQTLLYTEMVTAAALVRGGASYLLDYDAAEHPVALQLGGSDPAMLAEAVRLALPFGYDEINLNVGCPSDRVQSGAFGAVLMRDPDHVARIVGAMRDAAGDTEVTVKCRIGVDEQDPEEILPRFLEAMVGAGISRVTIHARKAWLQGLNPKENREIPPLDYGLVGRMKTRFPEMHISLNGGVTKLSEVQDHLRSGFDGVMVGRAAYHQPWDILAHADSEIFGLRTAVVAPEEAVRAMYPHVERERLAGTPLHHMTRHMLGVFAGRPGARAFRRTLSDGQHLKGAGPELIERALTEVLLRAA